MKLSSILKIISTILSISILSNSFAGQQSSGYDAFLNKQKNIMLEIDNGKMPKEFTPSQKKAFLEGLIAAKNAVNRLHNKNK